MSSHYIAFVIVMLVTGLAFWVVRPAFTKFMPDVDFVRRRNLWLALTVCVFLLPSFWLYMLAAAVLIAFVGKRDPNPAALYLFLLLVVPPVQQAVPGFGLVNLFFQLDHFRMLSLVLILPAAIRMRLAPQLSLKSQVRHRWLAADVLVLIYGVLPVLISAPYVSLTGSMRGVFYLGIDLLLPYYVLSRVCTSKKMVVEAIAAFALSAVVLALLAIFESAKGWLLFTSIAGNWGIALDDILYLFRSGMLRAQVTSGHSIVLGNVFAVALGLWLYLQARLTGWRRWLGIGAVIAGLLVSFSRGPWVGAAVGCFTFYAVGPNAMVRTLKFAGVSAVVAAIVLASPMGASVVDHLPFIGTVDEGNVTYRQLMIDRSWLLIQQNPLFGSPSFLLYMEDLRTGQGIIDLLNTYLTMGLAYGLVTVVAFVMFLAAAAFQCLRVTRLNAQGNPDTSKLGAALTASLAGTLVTINTVASFLSVPYIYMALAALMIAYSRIPAVAVDRGTRAGPSLRA